MMPRRPTHIKAGLLSPWLLLIPSWVSYGLPAQIEGLDYASSLIITVIFIFALGYIGRILPDKLEPLDTPRH